MTSGMYTRTSEHNAKISAAKKGIKNTLEHNAKISASMLGIRSNVYIEDRTHITPGTGRPLSYWDIQPLIRDRDGHVCQLCSMDEGENDEQLSVHHIDKNRTNSDPFNLVSLCRSCHRRVHRGENN